MLSLVNLSIVKPFTLVVLMVLALGMPGRTTPMAMQSTVFSVNSITDGIDPAINGICDANLNLAGNQCTVRAAIMEANATPVADTIMLPAAIYTLSLPGPGVAAGDLNITADLTIQGVPDGFAFPVVEGAPVWNDRLLTISTNVHVQISFVSLRKGQGGVMNMGSLTLSTASVNFNSGTGINNSGSLIVTNSTISHNTVTVETGGSGIRNSGVLTVTNSTIQNNSGMSGGGILNGNARVATIQNSVITNNTATVNSGGMYNNGTMTISGSTIADNSSPATAGGISNQVHASLTISDSTISGNSAATDGGGLENYGSLTMTNVTISGNTAKNGGGVLASSTDTARLNNVTLVGNSASTSAGGMSGWNETVILTNTIIANNTSPVGPDCQGQFASGGYNLIGTYHVGCTLSVAPGDILNQDPRLGALANNSGPTQTHALLAGSPAINAGSPAPVGSSGSACWSSDQRGVARTEGRCDIGAYELILQKIYLPRVSK